MKVSTGSKRGTSKPYMQAIGKDEIGNKTHHLTGTGRSTGDHLVHPRDAPVAARKHAADKVIDRQFDGLLRRHTHQLR